MTDPTTQCSGCGLKTFVGERIRHAKGCPVAAAAAEAKRTRMATRSPSQIKQALADKLTQCEDPVLAAELHKDFVDHDE